MHVDLPLVLPVPSHLDIYRNLSWWRNLKWSFCEAAKIDWLYQEDFDEKCREESAREKRVAERHGWLPLGLED